MVTRPFFIGFSIFTSVFAAEDAAVRQNIPVCQQILEAPTPGVYFKEQRDVIQVLLPWLKKNRRWPTKADYKESAAENRIPLATKFERILGINDYAPGKSFARLAVFPNPGIFWLALYFEQKKENLGLRLLDVKTQSTPSPRWRQYLREETIALVSEWMLREENRRLPTSKDFDYHDAKKIPIDYHRLTSTGHHATNEHQEAIGIYESENNALDAFRAAADSLGIDLSPHPEITLQEKTVATVAPRSKKKRTVLSPPSLLEPKKEVADVDISETNELESPRAIRMQNALNELLKSYLKSQGLKNQGKKLNIDALLQNADLSWGWLQLFGRGDYAEGKPLHEARIFDSLKQAEDLLKAVLSKRLPVKKPKT